MVNYLQRLNKKLKIKKLDSSQPIKVWIFVILLNLTGLAGYIFLKINNIN